MIPFEMIAPTMREYETTYGMIMPAQTHDVVPKVHRRGHQCSHVHVSGHAASELGRGTAVQIDAVGPLLNQERSES